METGDLATNIYGQNFFGNVMNIAVGKKTHHNSTDACILGKTGSMEFGAFLSDFCICGNILCLLTK